MISGKFNSVIKIPIDKSIDLSKKLSHALSPTQIAMFTVIILDINAITEENVFPK